MISEKAITTYRIPIKIIKLNSAYQSTPYYDIKSIGQTVRIPSGLGENIQLLVESTSLALHLLHPGSSGGGTRGTGRGSTTADHGSVLSGHCVDHQCVVAQSDEQPGGGLAGGYEGLGGHLDPVVRGDLGDRVAQTNQVIAVSGCDVVMRVLVGSRGGQHLGESVVHNVATGRIGKGQINLGLVVQSDVQQQLLRHIGRHSDHRAAALGQGGDVVRRVKRERFDDHLRPTVEGRGGRGTSRKDVQSELGRLQVDVEACGLGLGVALSGGQVETTAYSITASKAGEVAQVHTVHAVACGGGT